MILERDMERKEFIWHQSFKNIFNFFSNFTKILANFEVHDYAIKNSKFSVLVQCKL